MENQDPRNARIFTLHAPFKGPLQKKAFSLIQGGIERTLFLKELNNIYEGIAEKEDPRKFIDQALTALNVSYDITGLEAKSIPCEGPLVAVANHPFGGLEGLILASILLGVRSDTKLIANYLLARIPQLRTIVFPVDPFERRESTLRNLKPLRDSIAWLKAGNVLVVFPAGAVSYLRLQERQVIDPKWYNSVAKIVRKSRTDVLPVFFTGANSVLFQIAGLLHPNLKTALLPRELLNKKDKTITVRIGNLVPFRETAQDQP